MPQQRFIKAVVDYNDLLKKKQTKKDEIYKRSITRWKGQDVLSEDLYILSARLMIYSDEITRNSLMLACLEARNRMRNIFKEIAEGKINTPSAFSAKEVLEAYNFFLSAMLTIQEHDNDIRIYKDMSKYIAILDYMESIKRKQVYALEV